MTDMTDVTWSSDDVAYSDFVTWSPYLGMEVGMRRQITVVVLIPRKIGYNTTCNSRYEAYLV